MSLIQIVKERLAKEIPTERIEGINKQVDDFFSITPMERADLMLIRLMSYFVSKTEGDAAMIIGINMDSVVGEFNRNEIERLTAVLNGSKIR